MSPRPDRDGPLAAPSIAYAASAAWRAGRRGFVLRWVREIVRQSQDDDLALALTAVLLVELSARPGWFRAAEWTVRSVLDLVPSRYTRSKAAHLTVGPLQLRGAPWRRPDAVALGLRKLVQPPLSGLDWAHVATCWNGPSPSGRGSHAYAMALEGVFPTVQRLVRAARRA
jgi:hypothetical protein